MTKAAEMAKVSMKGGFNVFWSMAASKIISAVGVIVLARLLSPTEYGLVAVAWVAPSFLTNFRDWGVNSAVIRYSAQYRFEGNTANLRDVLLAGGFFELFTGALLSIILYLLSGFLATAVFDRVDLEPLIGTISFTIFSGALLILAQSVFTGFERMELYGVTLLSSSMFKAVFAPLLAVSGFGVLGVAVGSMLGLLIAGTLSIGIMYFFLRKKLQVSSSEKPKIRESLRIMLKYGAPLSIATILFGVRLQFYNFLMAIHVEDYLIGNYQVAVNFTVLITFFSLPIATVLFPAFSKIDAEKELKTLRYVFQFSVKLSAFLIVPAASAIIALSEPAISVLFGEQYGLAPFYLTIIAVNHLFAAFGTLSLTNLINSQGKTGVSLKLSLVSSAIGFSLSFLLIPEFGIVGLIVVTGITIVPRLLIGLWWLKRHYQITVDLISSVKIMLAAAVAAVVTYLTVNMLVVPSWVELLLGTTAFLVVYLTIAPAIGAINKADLLKLKEMAKTLGPLFHIINPLLAALEKMAPKTQEY